MKMQITLLLQKYTVEVHHCGYTWKVNHRYSEFKAMHDAVSEEDFITFNYQAQYEKCHFCWSNPCIGKEDFERINDKF